MLYSTEWNAFQRRWRLLNAYALCVGQILESEAGEEHKLDVIRLLTSTLHHEDENVPMDIIGLVNGELFLDGALPTYKELAVLAGEE